MRDLLSSGLGPLLERVELTCIDVGARGGFMTDLLPLAPAVNAVGFEPDPEECRLLNEAARLDPGPWRSLRFIPVALGRDEGNRQLHLAAKRGCSSILEADLELAAQYARDDYFRVEGTVPLTTAPLDDVAARHGLGDVSFMKIDVQGLEMEILESGRRLLEKSVLGLRLEVSFRPFYKGQPLADEIVSWLRGYGFYPVGFPELHAWRRATKKKLPDLDKGRFPYSRGELAHGDMLFFRDPASLDAGSEGGVITGIRGGLLALCYGYLDLALAYLDIPEVRQRFNEICGMDPARVLSSVSYDMAGEFLALERSHLTRGLRRWLRKKVLLWRRP